MPSRSRPLMDFFCEPCISLFDPPTYVVASLRDAVASFNEARRTESPISTAAAPLGIGQEVS